jgi:hypothetical protein
MNPDCPDCERLWNEIRSATFAEIALQGKLRVAQLRHDPDKQ